MNEHQRNNAIKRGNANDITCYLHLSFTSRQTNVFLEGWKGKVSSKETLNSQRVSEESTKSTWLLWWAHPQIISILEEFPFTLVLIIIVNRWIGATRRECQQESTAAFEAYARYILNIPQLQSTAKADIRAFDEKRYQMLTSSGTNTPWPEWSTTESWGRQFLWGMDRLKK